MAGTQVSRNIAMTTSQEFSGKCIIATVTGLKTAISALNIVSTSLYHHLDGIIEFQKSVPRIAAKEAGDQEEVSL